MLLDTPGFMQFWGKARPSSEAGPRFHPLAWHGLDVAAAFLALLEAWPEQKAALVACFDGEAEEAVAGLAALVALHDLGKFAPDFQAKAPEAYPRDALGEPRDRRALDHAAAGYALAESPRHLAGLFMSLLGENDFDRAALLAPVFGHHGRPVSCEMDLARAFGRPDGPATLAARSFVERVLDHFERPVLPPLRRGATRDLSWRLAGLVALSDWIGSDERHFPYACPDIPFDVYRRDAALPAARRALAAGGLLRARIATGDSLAIVTGGAYAPTQGQVWAAETDCAEGGLFVIEDVTGSGKTEAALILAHRLMLAGRAGGIYVALPTMATANGLYRRLARSYRALYAPGERPSIVLAHGARALDPAFARSIEIGPREPEPGYGGGEGEEDETGSAACARWLAEDRRRAFLAEIGVGTIDQALLAVLPVKHAPVRQLGLSRQVLVIDEAHAYDPYMQAEIEALVAHQSRLGAPVIVLSATLPADMRARLVKAWTGRAPAPEDGLAPYPAATAIAGRQGRATRAPLAARADLVRAVCVTRLADADAAMERIARAAAAGAAVAWIRNSVDDAREAAAALRERGLAVDLFHARFAMGDRLAVEESVVARFGKDGAAAERAGRVLVATQVVEQSLDLDFDFLVTDLAPIDSMIQRAGRLWRHVRGARPAPGPELAVVSPEPVPDAPGDWHARAFPIAQFVYPDHARLWLGARALFARPVMRVPQDLRGLIEAVYGPDADESVPAALRPSGDEASGKALASRSVARLNLLDFEAGYDPASGAWGPDTLTPTREGDERVTLRLGRLEAGEIVPLRADPDPRRAWALSEVSVSQSRFRGREGLDPALEARAAAIEEEFARRSSPARLVLLAPAPAPAPGETFAFRYAPGPRGTGEGRYCRRGGLILG